jgi:hypothetical protein
METLEAILALSSNLMKQRVLITQLLTLCRDVRKDVFDQQERQKTDQVWTTETWDVVRGKEEG